MLLTPAKIKPKSFQSRRNSFLPGVDAPHVYVRAWALCCFYSLISTQTPSTGYDILPSENGARGEISTRTFRRALTRFGGQLRGDEECPFTVAYLNLAEFGGGCRKATLGV